MAAAAEPCRLWITRARTALRGERRGLTLLGVGATRHLAINKRKEVIRCLMVQQWGRFSSFGGSASDRVGPPRRSGLTEVPWSPGLELSGR